MNQPNNITILLLLAAETMTIKTAKIALIFNYVEKWYCCHFSVDGNIEQSTSHIWGNFYYNWIYAITQTSLSDSHITLHIILKNIMSFLENNFDTAFLKTTSRFKEKTCCLKIALTGFGYYCNVCRNFSCDHSTCDILY